MRKTYEEEEIEVFVDPLKALRERVCRAEKQAAAEKQRADRAEYELEQIREWAPDEWTVNRIDNYFKGVKK